MGVGKMLVPISVTLDQGHQTIEAVQILPCHNDKMRTAHAIATKLGRYIPLDMLSTRLNFGGILYENFLTIFSR